ncbi:MAG: FAD-dependent oxidoreductase, partial [Paracoccus marcusii]
MADVTIIGAGVAGLFAAHVLVQRGLTPRILDRIGAPGPHGCSWWAGGMLAPRCEGGTADPVITRLGAEAADAWSVVTPVTRRGTLVLALERDRAEL